ncbi:MAG: cytochrome c oxidase subunit II [Anaerolineae bacterium]|nr:cytochrome c oxidase subunit II [Anaerolineae bacterium]
MKKDHRVVLRLRRAAAVLFATVLVAVLVPLQAFAAPPTPLRPGSGNAAVFGALFWPILAIATVVFVLVEGLLIFAIVRYRRRYDDDTPVQVHGNNTLELIWTIIPALIMAVLFAMTLVELQKERNTPPDAMRIEVTGHQWYWEFYYPETGLKLDSRTTTSFFIPTDRPVAFEVTSKDVIHSFWVPQLNGKMDAIPGRVNTVWAGDVKPGTYAGQCAEFCGLRHYNMLFNIIAVTPEDFDVWMQAQVFLASQFRPVGTDIEAPLPSGEATSGEALFVAQGCVACHSLDGSTLVGPSMQGMAGRAEGRSTELSAEQYLHQSIVLPCEYVVDGFACVMPQNFGTEKLDAQALADLIAYLETLE